MKRRGRRALTVPKCQSCCWPKDVKTPLCLHLLEQVVELLRLSASFGALLKIEKGDTHTVLFFCFLQYDWLNAFIMHIYSQEMT